jgi:serine/threonine protein kinase
VTTDRAGTTRRLPGHGPWFPRHDRLLGGRYLLGELLATGGMGEVWAAEDLVLGRPVAVKLLGGVLAGDGRAAERLRREARAAARLGHPGIARVLDLGDHDGRPYLVMELLHGESLAARLARAGPLHPAAAAAVVAAVADALEAAHRAGVVHRDVKPGNVLLTDAGEVKVLDFGIASAAGDAALTTGDLLGTPAYLAPERVLGQRATPAADVYALGVLLYELLAGERPFEADSDIELAMAHVNAQPPPLRRVAPAAPPSLVAACEAAMAKDPAARVPSAAAFADLLHRPATPATEVPHPAASSEVATRPLSAAADTPRTRPLPVGRALPAAPALPSHRPGPARPRPARPRPARPRPPGPLPAGRRRGRGRRLGLVAALLVAGTLLAVLPALGDGWLSGSGQRVEPPALVEDAGGETSVAPGGNGNPLTEDPSAGADRRADGRRSAGGGRDDRDRDDDGDGDGSGRSGGGGGGRDGDGGDDGDDDGDGGGGRGGGGGSSGPG